MYYQCPFCSHNYKGRIPKGGDGSALFFPKHQRKITAQNSIGGGTYSPILRKELCPGSYREINPSRAI